MRLNNIGIKFMKDSWGVKRTCTSCESRFYDLGKVPATCPKCLTVLELATSAIKGKKGSKSNPLNFKDAIDVSSLGLVDAIDIEKGVVDDSVLLDEDVDEDFDVDIADTAVEEIDED